MLGCGEGGPDVVSTGEGVALGEGGGEVTEGDGDGIDGAERTVKGNEGDASSGCSAHRMCTMKAPVRWGAFDVAEKSLWPSLSCATTSSGSLPLHTTS